jgi:hypothetical protein
MGLFSKKPAPSPSDIVAELVAARMISDPQSVKFETLKFNYPFGAIWEDENTGIVVEFSNTECDGYPSSFTQMPISQKSNTKAIWRHAQRLNSCSKRNHKLLVDT